MKHRKDVDIFAAIDPNQIVFVATNELGDTLIGNDNDNLMVGHRGPDVIDGGLGADTMYGGLSADTLIGGDGADSLEGGAGADLLNGGAGPDAFVFAWYDSPNVDLLRDTIGDLGADDFVDLSGIAASTGGVHMTMANLEIDASRIVVHVIPGNTAWDMGIDYVGIAPTEANFIF